MYYKLIKYIIILFCVCIFILFCKKTIINPSIKNYVLVDNYQNKLHKSGGILKEKTVLLWTKFFTSENWNLDKNSITKSDFENYKCPETACVITRNVSYLEEIFMYDAVVFHVAEIWFPYYTVPNVRSPQQQYIFFSLESPINTKHELAYDNNFYNLTMSYRLDSDIVIDYGILRDKLTNITINPSKYPNWKTPETQFYDHNLYLETLKKSKKIAWFVSNCGAISKRDDLAKSINKKISVDIYGKCGSLSCEENCDVLLEQEYKFYLSFENSLCEDYITEKFYNILKLNVIPIVYGGADYKRFAPPNSYINANEFQSVLALSEYLIYLDENPKEYIKYFWWKSYYYIDVSSLMIRRFCDLCIKLHNTNSMEKLQSYKNIKEWWFDNACHTSTNIQF